MSFFIEDEFCLLAHRGLSQHRNDLDENSLDAFAEALNYGATHIESDIQATSDGIAILFHDRDLRRTAGINKKISELSFDQLKQIRLSAGGKIPSLEEALTAFPDARFNLDLKTDQAVGPTSSVLESLSAHKRVLLSSFDYKTRQQVLSKTNHLTVSSADARAFLKLYAAILLAPPLISRINRDFQALQIPVNKSFLRFDSPRFTSTINSLGLHLHYWTINDPAEMVRLARFATGIVTDRVDLAPNSLRS